MNLRLGVPITNEFTFQPNYSIYQSQIKVPDSQSQPYDDCGAPGNPISSTVWTPGGTNTPQTATTGSNCLTNGEASLAIKDAASQGAITTSLVGYSLIWDNLDNRKNPTTGLYANFHQDVAGLGGQSQFVRETFDSKFYYPVTDDVVTMFRLQGGEITGLGSESHALPILDNFNLGPSLVRGFASGGIGPRDISDPNNLSTNGLGGTTYFGGTTELQFPIFGLPKELGLRGALFADAGTLYGFDSKTDFSRLLGYSYCPAAGSTPITQPSCLRLDDEHMIRSSVGVSVLWASPIGPLRFDLAYPITKGKYDQTQYFNFSGGASF